VLIADDHRLFVEALEAILAAEDRITVVGQAADGGEAVRLAQTLLPDVVLMDIPRRDRGDAADLVEAIVESSGRL